MTKQEFLQEISSKFSAEEEISDFIDYIDDLEIPLIEDYDDLIEELYNNNFFRDEGSFTYYVNAMNYLSENDRTLSKSISIAKEFGMKLENIDSVKLASLLKEKNLKYSFVIYKEEINKGLNDCQENTRCYCGEEIEDGDFCSKECYKHYFDEIT